MDSFGMDGRPHNVSAGPTQAARKGRSWRGKTGRSPPGRQDKSIENRRAIAVLGFPIVAIVAVGFIYWVKAMGDKAEEISHRALDARRGAFAEEDVGTLLGALPTGYFVVHDFVSNRGNIDHIVVSSK